ncbi:MAG: DUF4097 family beta strand repeat protein [Oscillospiraceae bacterium]|nr:DUF4097 family beta strand repeat protein [Oscillospiraceae bacterium]
MGHMKTRMIIAVAERLSAAADSSAKTELVEELSENLYQRYVDMVSSGVAEEEAYRRAMEDLGDVTELLEYLEESQEKEPEEAQTQRYRKRDYLNDFLHGVEDVVRETIVQMKDAVGQAKNITRDIGRKFHEKYPDGFERNFRIHFEDDRPDGGNGGFSMGYDKERGGFFWESAGKGHLIAERSISAEHVSALDIQLHNGDVTLRVQEQETVELCGDTEELEVRLTDDGVLSVRQGKTASSSVLFGHGFASTDVEVLLPHKLWERMRLSTITGDICMRDMEIGQLEAQTVSGDFRVERISCPNMNLKTVSGDIHCETMQGSVRLESVSGDVSVDGDFMEVHSNTVSGDISVGGTVRSVACHSMSGDIRVEQGVLPEKMTLNSKSGDCGARIPSEQGFTLNFSTKSGELHTDFDLVGPMGRKSGSATYLGGGDRTFTLSSFSGDLMLKQY